jgi:biotin synthase
MPKARVRLSAGRREMGEAVQALCFAAGANSIFYGEKLLTTGNPDVEADRELLAKLGMNVHAVQLQASRDEHAGSAAKEMH